MAQSVLRGSFFFIIIFFEIGRNACTLLALGIVECMTIAKKYIIRKGEQDYDEDKRQESDGAGYHRDRWAVGGGIWYI